MMMKIQFSKKIHLVWAPYIPTERQKHVQTMVQLMYYCKNTGCITKNALGDRYDDFEKHEKCWFFRKIYVSHHSPRPYRTLQTRANDGTSCLLPEKHGFHDEKCSGGLVRWFVKWCEKCQFSKKIHLVSPPYILQNAKNMCKRCCSWCTTAKTRVA